MDIWNDALDVAPKLLQSQNPECDWRHNVTLTTSLRLHGQKEQSN